jgi:hypothetical protein
LAGGLTGGIDIKDNEATPLPIEDSPDGFCGPSIGEAVPLKEDSKGFKAGTIHSG